MFKTFIPNKKLEFDQVLSSTILINNIEYVYAYYYLQNKKVKYVCTGFSFISSDGDYKLDIIDVSDKKFITTTLKEYIKITELLLLEGILKLWSPKLIGDWELITFAIIVAKVSARDFTEIGKEDEVNNINPIFSPKIVRALIGLLGNTDNKEKTKELIDRINEKIENAGYGPLAFLQYKTNILGLTRPSPTYLSRYGQKIIPLMLQDICDNTLVSTPMREMYVNHYTNRLYELDLGLFSYMVDFSFVFDNPIPMEKFLSNYSLLEQKSKYGAKYKNIMKQIKNARVDMNTTAMSMLLSNTRRTHQMYDNDYLIIINMIIGPAFTDVIVRDMVNVSSDKITDDPLASPIYTQSMVMWLSLLCSLRSLHAHGIAHGDLHLNNICVSLSKPLYSLHSDFNRYVKKHKIPPVNTGPEMTKVSGEYKKDVMKRMHRKTSYVKVESESGTRYYDFGNDFVVYSPYIIDFSRAFLDNTKHELDVEFETHQHKMAVHLIKTYFPKLHKAYEKTINTRLGRIGGDTFMLISAFDVYVPTMIYGIYLRDLIAKAKFTDGKKLPPNHVKILESCIKIGKSINDIISKYIEMYLDDLMHGKMNIPHWFSKIIHIFDNNATKVDSKNNGGKVIAKSFPKFSDIESQFKPINIHLDNLRDVAKRKCTKKYKRTFLK